MHSALRHIIMRTVRSVHDSGLHVRNTGHMPACIQNKYNNDNNNHNNKRDKELQ